MDGPRHPYRHHGPAVYGSKLLDYLISEHHLIEDGFFACRLYAPDLTAGGTDCKRCGHPYEQHQ